VCVHEQFMTETAAIADIVLPATMFLEHDDVYQGGGHQHILLGPKIVEPPGECRSNHTVICELAKRLGAQHQGFAMTPREIVDWTLQHSGWGDLARLERERWIDCQPPFDEAHYLSGFAHADRKFHFAPDWSALPPQGFGAEPLSALPRLPDHHAVIEEATAEMPFRLVTAPARHYLNSSFTETPTSRRRQRQPTVMMHPDDAAALALTANSRVRMGNSRGEVELALTLFDGMQRGVVISESVWPNRAFPGGIGINALTGADPAGPLGGAAFHDNRVWIRPAAATPQ
ncbi:MAG: molybdopterin dinucleotide binding domain-containing protein, partial [Gammaproteobacteria bacterium]